MPETGKEKTSRTMKIRYRQRGSQVWIYLGKLLRMFVYQNDWKVLPMSALIAGLVGLVTRRTCYLTMEGTLMGAFAMTCVCIWNGCFNSIQVICRERDVIKREHRSGMHISSYIFAHMLYQGLLCMVQTGVTLYVTRLVGVHYPTQGLFTRWFMLDIGVTMFLITFASDMMSLWISSLAKTTTTAMTIMPFVLIFQLVFSGGMLQLPEWSKPITYLTISNPGLKAIAAQADLNNLPFVTITTMLDKLEDNPIEGTVRLQDVLEMLQSSTNDMAAEVREMLLAEDSDMTVGDYLEFLLKDPEMEAARNGEIPFKTTVGELMDIAGRDKVKTYIEQEAAGTRYSPDYECTRDNIIERWLWLLLFAFGFAALAVITLEFIDKDKR